MSGGSEILRTSGVDVKHVPIERSWVEQGTSVEGVTIGRLGGTVDEWKYDILI